jgi:hypothetical protein
MTTRQYYHRKWRAASLCMLATACLGINCLIAAGIAALYESPPWCIGLACGAAFFGFVTRIKYQDAEVAWKRCLRAG